MYVMYVLIGLVVVYLPLVWLMISLRKWNLEGQ